MVDIEIEVEDLNNLEAALRDGVNDGASETARWAVDEGKNKAQDFIRAGDSEGHPRIWRRQVYQGFVHEIDRRGHNYHAELRNTAPHATIVETGRRPGAVPPPVQKLMSWVVDKLDPATVRDYDGFDGDDGSHFTKEWYDDSAPDDTILSTNQADFEWKDRQKNSLEANADHHGMSLDEYKQALKSEYEDLTEDATTRIRIHYDNFLGVLNDGRFKSQFESGKSGGLLNPSYRSDFEEDWLGFDPDAPDRERPIYGYLGTSNVDTGDPQGVGQYGDVRVVLKDSVRERTTFTVGDSLDDNSSSVTDGFSRGVQTLPSWLNSPGHKADAIRSALSDPETQLEKLRGMDDVTDVGRYFEAQIHGGVDVDDIEVIVFTGDGPTSNMKIAMEDLGIEWRVE